MALPAKGPLIRAWELQGGSRAKQHELGIWAPTVMSASLRTSGTSPPHPAGQSDLRDPDALCRFAVADINTARLAIDGGSESMEISPDRFPFLRFDAILRASPGSGR
jgi:hypothetical protein